MALANTDFTRTFHGLYTDFTDFSRTLHGLTRTLHGLYRTTGLYRTLHGLYRDFTRTLRTLHGLYTDFTRTLHGREMMSGFCLVDFADGNHSGHFQPCVVRRLGSTAAISEWNVPCGILFPALGCGKPGFPAASARTARMQWFPGLSMIMAPPVSRCLTRFALGLRKDKPAVRRAIARCAEFQCVR